MKVFISYSHTDATFVDQVTKILTRNGVSFFRDTKDVAWGQDMAQEVAKALADSSAIIVVISPSSLKSQWVPFEIGQASALGKTILPLLTHPALDLPDYLKRFSYKTTLEQVEGYFASLNERHHLNVNEKGLSEFHDRVIEDLKKATFSIAGQAKQRLIEKLTGISADLPASVRVRRVHDLLLRERELWEQRARDADAEIAATPSDPQKILAKVMTIARRDQAEQVRESIGECLSVLDAWEGSQKDVALWIDKAIEEIGRLLRESLDARRGRTTNEPEAGVGSSPQAETANTESRFSDGDWIAAGIVGPERAVTVLQRVAYTAKSRKNVSRQKRIDEIELAVTQEVRTLRSRYEKGGVTEEDRCEACIAKIVVDIIEREMVSYRWRLSEESDADPLEAFKAVVRELMDR